MMIISAVAGVLVLSLMTIGIWIYIRAKKKQLTSNETSKKNQAKSRMKSGSTSSNMKSKCIHLSKLHTGKINMPTIDEFEKLPRKPSNIQNFTTRHADLKQNQGFIGNKFAVPYDQTRVQLKHSVNNVDFINASWVHIAQTSEGVYDIPIVHPFLPSSLISLIVAQSPTKNTIDHHLQMAYEAKVQLIVEISQNASINGGEQFDGAIVSKKRINKLDLSEILTREVWDLSKDRDKTERLIHLRLKGWNTSGELSEAMIENMLTTLTQSRKEIGNSQEMTTMLVHDEHGGAGGASVFTALLYLLEEVDDAVTAAKSHVGKLEDKDFTINVFETVHNLRSKRMGMIQNIEEYIFLHQALIFYMKNKEQFDDLLIHQEDYLSSQYPDPTELKWQSNDEMEEEYVLHNPQLEEDHECVEEYKIYNNDGELYENDNMYLA